MEGRGGQLCRGEVSFPREVQVRVRSGGDGEHGKSTLAPVGWWLYSLSDVSKWLHFSKLTAKRPLWKLASIPPSLPVLRKETPTVRSLGALSHHITQGTGSMNRCNSERSLTLTLAYAVCKGTLACTKLACTTRDWEPQVALASFLPKHLANLSHPRSFFQI